MQLKLSIIGEDRYNWCGQTYLVRTDIIDGDRNDWWGQK